MYLTNRHMVWREMERCYKCIIHCLKLVYEMFTNVYNVKMLSALSETFSGVSGIPRFSIFVNAGQMVGDAVGGAFRSAVNAVLWND